ncbi:hypothetical protein LguiA_029965 [Lonicera macranthoides]
MEATTMPGMQDNMTMARTHNHTTMTMGMTMHTAFYWGNDAEFLFFGWPGTNKSGMYVLSLILIFALAFIVEWLSHSTFIKQSLPLFYRTGGKRHIGRSTSNPDVYYTHRSCLGSNVVRDVYEWRRISGGRRWARGGVHVIQESDF